MNYAEYLLSKVGEEGGEAGKAANKLAVFGRFSTNPENGLTNEQELIKEIHDFFAAVEMLHENGIIDFKYDPALVIAKKEKVIYHAKKTGILAGEFTPATREGFLDGTM